MTDPAGPEHSPGMLTASALLPSASDGRASGAPPLSFASVYEAHFAYVWRSVRALGVPEGSVDDAVQEVFVVVHRKLATFEARSTVKTWVYGIAMRVARAHRRTNRTTAGEDDAELDRIRAPTSAQPDMAAERAEAARVVNRLLAGLDDDQREVFVLAELEQLSAPEIADALEVKLNTVYSRLRLARAAFAEAAARHRAEEKRRSR